MDSQASVRVIIKNLCSFILLFLLQILLALNFHLIEITEIQLKQDNERELAR